MLLQLITVSFSKSTLKPSVYTLMANLSLLWAQRFDVFVIFKISQLWIKK